MARTLDLLILACTAILAIRLFTADLYRRYRVFFFYLVFETLRATAVISLGQSSDSYQKFWVVSEPVEWLLYVLVVLEISSLVLQDYKGLSTAGRWVLITAVVGALLASGISLLAPSLLTGQGPLMRYYYVAERAVYFSLVVFLLSNLGLLMQYPITLNRNTILHSMVFSVYFLGNTVIYLLLSMRGYDTLPAVVVGMDMITLAALATWLVRLKPAGELSKLRLRPQWMPGKEEDLIGQLNHLNMALLRATGNRPK